MTWKTRVDLDGLTVEADARFGHFPMGALNVSGGALSVSGKWGELSVAGTAGGIVGEKPFALDIGGGVKWDGSQLDVGLSRVTVEFAGVQAALSESLRFRAWNGSNEISAAWHMGVDDLAMASNVVPQGVKGRMQADLRVGGTLAMPELTGRVTCEGFVAPWYGLSTIAAVSGTCEAGLSNGLLNAALMVSFATGGVVTAKVHAPVELSLQPWRFHVDREQPLVAGMEASLNLSVLNRLDAFANSRVGGRLDLAVAHSGTLASGGVTGTCTLVEGEYENFLLGTIIRGAQVKFVVQDKVLRVEGGKATDGGSGQFTLAGNVSIDPAEGFPYAFELGGQKARLLRRPDVKATVTGRLGVEGTLSSIRANGKVHIDEALVELMNFRPAPPESVGAAPAESRVSARSVGDTNITLRLEVDIPGNLYVRGRTLDSAWAGNLVLGYTGGALGLSGYLEPRRGTLLLLKRPFKLSEGRIEFAEGWPPDPSLRLIATYSRPDLQAQVSIVGKMGNPEIVLSSEPALPEDEILARILFGKDMSTVTPLQAISLASEATKLRKLGGGTGVMGDVQEAVGIDRVEFREAGEGAAAPEVAAGKYLGDRSYVEMRRTTSSSQSGQTQLYLEHELRPNIVLEAESGIEMRSGVGIFWKMDY